MRQWQYWYVPCAYLKFKFIGIFSIDRWFNSHAVRFPSINSDRFDSHSILVFLKQFFLQFNHSTLADRFKTDTIPKGCDLKPSFGRYTITRYFTILKSNKLEQIHGMNGKFWDFFPIEFQRDCLCTLWKWVFISKHKSLKKK